MAQDARATGPQKEADASREDEQVPYDRAEWESRLVQARAQRAEVLAQREAEGRPAGKKDISTRLVEARQAAAQRSAEAEAADGPPALRLEEADRRRAASNAAPSGRSRRGRAAAGVVLACLAGGAALAVMQSPDLRATLSAAMNAAREATGAAIISEESAAAPKVTVQAVAPPSPPETGTGVPAIGTEPDGRLETTDPAPPLPAPAETALGSRETAGAPARPIPGAPLRPAGASAPTGPTPSLVGLDTAPATRTAAAASEASGSPEMPRAATPNHRPRVRLADPASPGETDAGAAPAFASFETEAPPGTAAPARAASPGTQAEPEQATAPARAGLVLTDVSRLLPAKRTEVPDLPGGAARNRGGNTATEPRRAARPPLVTPEASAAAARRTAPMQLTHPRTEAGPNASAPPEGTAGSDAVAVSRLLPADRTDMPTLPGRVATAQESDLARNAPQGPWAARAAHPPIGVFPFIGPPAQVVVHYPPDAEGDAADAAALLRRAGLKADLVPVDIAVDEANVRYYHPADSAAAGGISTLLAGRLDLSAPTVRDFTDFRPQPRAGIVELWLQGTPPAAGSDDETDARPAFTEAAAESG